MKPKEPVAVSSVKGNTLIVDDTPDNLRLLSQVLSERGHKARVAPGGNQALLAARSAPPDLILLDVSMPDMDGYEVCQRLQADENTRDIPITFLSAVGQIEDKVRAFTCGGRSLRDGRPQGVEEQERLFTPFERLHQTRAEGHGLGLYRAAHRGKVGRSLSRNTSARQKDERRETKWTRAFSENY